MKRSIRRILLYAFLIGICPGGIAIAAALMLRERIRMQENRRDECFLRLDGDGNRFV